MNPLFILLIMFVLTRLVGGGAKRKKDKGDGQSPSSMSREQRERLARLRNTIQKGVTGNQNQPWSELTHFDEDDEYDVDDFDAEEEENYPFAFSQATPSQPEPVFYDDVWDAPVGASVSSAEHRHDSADCSFGAAPGGHSSAGGYDFDSASRGSRLRANDNWKHRPPVIAPARPAPPSLFSQLSVPQGEAVQAAPDSAPAISARDMRQAVVMSEILKRPRPGVAPRYR